MLKREILDTLDTLNTAGNIQIVKMEHKHIEDVYAIENNSFSIPWTKTSMETEILKDTAYYFVAVNNNGTVCGYCGIWHIVNEGHLVNIAVASEYRRQGIGAKLLEQIINLSYEKNMMGITLEVRMNNAAAHALYAKYGFKPEGIRKNYYSDTKEDAIIMWKYLQTKGCVQYDPKANSRQLEVDVRH